MSLRDWFRQRPMVAPDPHPAPSPLDALDGIGTARTIDGAEPPRGGADAAFDSLPIEPDQRREPIYAEMVRESSPVEPVRSLRPDQVPLYLDLLKSERRTTVWLDCQLAGLIDDTEGGAR